MVTLAKQVIQTADDMYSVNRRLSRNPGGGPPNESAGFINFGDPQFVKYLIKNYG